ncbi:MAG: hypothetical protein ACRYGP_23595 [Janthinobacterium lividum]
MRPSPAPPPPGLISLHPTSWSAAITADFGAAFPTNIVDRVFKRDLSRPRPAGRPAFARKKTVHNARYAMAIFEGMIHDRFPARLGSPLGEQVDGDTLRCFVEHLRATNSPRSVVDHLTRLIYILKRLGLSYQALLARMERAGIKVPARRKRQVPFTTAQLWVAGERLIAEAKTRRRKAPLGRERAAFLRATGERYRDGLLLCFSALCIPRIANTGSMIIGQHLFHRDKVYRLHFPPEEVKTKQPIDAAVPDILVDHFETYLDSFRDLIRRDGRQDRGDLHDRDKDHLWPSRFGGNLSLGGLHQVYKRHFKRILGVDAASHDCRRAAADCVTLDPRAPTNLAQLVLQHKNGRTVWRYVSVKSESLAKLVGQLTGC